MSEVPDLLTQHIAAQNVKLIEANKTLNRFIEQVNAAIRSTDSALQLQRNQLPHEAKRIMDSAASETLKELSKQVGRIAQQIAGDTAAAENNKSFVLAFGGAIGLVLCCGFAFGSLGFMAGEKKGYEAAKDEKAAAAWANTPEGVAAYKLARATGGEAELLHLLLCNQPGWEISKEKNHCYPRATKDAIYGWRIRSS